MPPGVGQAFDARGDVDRVAVEALAVDQHVAEVHADPELEAAALRKLRVALTQEPLDLDGGRHRVHDAAELGEDVVPGSVDDTAAKLDRWCRA